MNNEQVREIVRITIQELLSQNALKDPYNLIKTTVERELRLYFTNQSDRVSHALHQLSDDRYIDIIYLYYRDELTLERIAELLDVDTTTVNRNRKRLIIRIYQIIK